ncbi:LysR substrate-binding domain-containing protein [Celerinatantimonas sp. MCCC 1A17872]
MELNTLEAIMLAVEKGLGLTFVSRLAVKERLESKRLIQLNLTGYYPRQLHLAWHKKVP